MRLSLVSLSHPDVVPPANFSVVDRVISSLGRARFASHYVLIIKRPAETVTLPEEQNPREIKDWESILKIKYHFKDIKMEDTDTRTATLYYVVTPESATTVVMKILVHAPVSTSTLVVSTAHLNVTVTVPKSDAMIDCEDVGIREEVLTGLACC